jgi:hypothetical protein
MSESKRLADDPAIMDELRKILARENRSSALVPHEHEFAWSGSRYQCKVCSMTRDELGASAIEIAVDWFPLG